MKQPAYIKISSRKPLNPWTKVNQDALLFLKKMGNKFGCQGNSLYLIGSAAGREEAERVNDLDLVVLIPDTTKIWEAEKLARQNKKIKNIKLPITYVFFPLEWLKRIDQHVLNPRVSPVFFTYVKANHVFLGGEDFLAKPPWPAKAVLKKDAILNVKTDILTLFKEINKARYTKEQNYLVLKILRSVIFNSMYSKFYFGFSKTQFIQLFLHLFKLKNKKPVELFYLSRRLGREHFLKQEPRQLQNETLLFAQELWSKIGQAN